MKSTTLVHYVGPFTCRHASSYLSPTKKASTTSKPRSPPHEFCKNLQGRVLLRILLYSSKAPGKTHFVIVSGSHNISTAVTNFNNVVVFRLQHHVSINHIYSISLSISSGYNSIVCVHCIIIKLKTVPLKYFLLGLFIKSSVSLLIIPNSMKMNLSL